MYNAQLRDTTNRPQLAQRYVLSLQPEQTSEQDAVASPAHLTPRFWSSANAVHRSSGFDFDLGRAIDHFASSSADVKKLHALRRACYLWSAGRTHLSLIIPREATTPGSRSKKPLAAPDQPYLHRYSLAVATALSYVTHRAEVLALEPAYAEPTQPSDDTMNFLRPCFQIALQTVFDAPVLARATLDIRLPEAAAWLGELFGSRRYPLGGLRIPLFGGEIATRQAVDDQNELHGSAASSPALADVDDVLASMARAMRHPGAPRLLSLDFHAPSVSAQNAADSSGSLALAIHALFDELRAPTLRLLHIAYPSGTGPAWPARATPFIFDGEKMPLLEELVIGLGPLATLGPKSSASIFEFKNISPALCTIAFQFKERAAPAIVVQPALVLLAWKWLGTHAPDCACPATHASASGIELPQGLASTQIANLIAIEQHAKKLGFACFAWHDVSRIPLRIAHRAKDGPLVWSGASARFGLFQPTL